jgi:kynurenine formamidase
MGISPSRIASEEEWLGYFESLSNWGRWGPEDSLGTLNLITDSKVLNAARLIEVGTHVSCARVVDFGDRCPVTESRTPPLHFFSHTGQNPPSRGGSGAMDWLGIPLHGLHITHLDAHAHAFWDGRMYNGKPASAVSAETGARAGSTHPLSNGVVTRGVLMDVPRALGVEALPPGFAVGADELDLCARQAGVTPEPGDLLMVRTGYGGARRSRGPVGTPYDAPGSPDAPHLPGVGVAALPWLRQNDVAIVGTDTGTDARPAPYSFNAPVHAVALCAMGMWVIDNLDLEDVSEACARYGRGAFLVTVAPIKLKNATGSPVNPIAVF